MVTGLDFHLELPEEWKGKEMEEMEEMEREEGGKEDVYL